MVNEKIADRLRKLLALSQSSNQHEAAIAAARAAELMAEHQIEAAMLAEAEREPIDQEVLETFGTRVTWKGMLANGISYSFGCRVYWSRGIDEGKRWTRLMIVGRKADADAARYTFHYLCNEVNRLATSAWDARHSDKTLFHTAREWKNGFRVGAASTIAQRLRQARDESLARARGRQDDEAPRVAAALLRLERDEAELDAFMARLGLRHSRSRITASGSGMCAGTAAGHSVDIGADRNRLGRPVARLKSAPR